MARRERAKTAATGGMTLVEVVATMALLAVVALILVTCLGGGQAHPPGDRHQKQHRQDHLRPGDARRRPLPPTRWTAPRRRAPSPTS